MKSKGAKLGGGLIGGSGAVAMLVSFVNAKENSLKQYVDSKHEVAIVEIVNMKDDVKDIKGGIKRLEDYLINKQQKKGD